MLRLWCLLICLLVCVEELTTQAATGYTVTNALPGLTFTNPVCIASPPGELNRLFVVERRGRIVVITNLAAPTRSIFMDISARVINPGDSNVGGEEGLLGLAFHPGYATNGFFYLFYTGTATTPAGSGRHDILSRFTVSNTNPNQGNPNSEIAYIRQIDGAGNHNGGDLHFGPDGYLYVSLGDEGGAYGNFPNTQKIDRNFFSALMRIDVDNRRPGSLPPNPHVAIPSLTNYSIPADNYFVGATTFNNSPVDPANVRTEFWAVGLRNPWRFSIDTLIGTVYVGDVGQGTFEWVNIVTNGANCGWNFYEGRLRWTNNLPAGFVQTPPLIQYGHTNGRTCIIGGVVYRGSKIPQLNGSYIYGDHASGEIWALRHSGMTVTENSLLVSSTSARFNAFGIDPSNGDILGARPRNGTNSSIERLIYTNQVPVPVITEVNQSGTALSIIGTGGPANQTYHLVTSTNIQSGGVGWSPVATGVFNGSGGFSINSTVEPTTSQRFYRLQLP
jgi:glucose/arabinose dehydrogenase